MKTYKYFAIKKDGTKVEGKIEANNEKEARAAIVALKLFPTRIINPDDSVYTETAVRKKQAEERRKAGVPLIEALVFLETDTNSSRMKTISAELRRQIIAGSSFADVVARYPQIFDSLYTGLVKAGEESGELDVTLERMSGLLKKQDDLKNKVIGVLVYPCIVLVFAALIVLVMLTFVFPKFAEMYEGMGAQLPWITQTCIDAGKFIAEYWMLLPIVGGAIYWGIKLLFQWQPFKRRLDIFLLSLPLVRDFVKLAEFSNFISVMLVSYEAGVPIVDCLYLANYTVGNTVLRDAIDKARVRVQQGANLSASLKATDVMPPILLFMVSTGEQSGKLGDMLGKASEYIDNQLDRVIEMLTKFIEPLMLVVIGAVVLVMALALYLPLFQSYSNIGN